MIRRALTVASLLLVVLFSTAATAAAQDVTLNGVPVVPGNHTVKAGDKITLTNNTNQNMPIQTPNGQVILPPGGALTYVVGNGAGPLVFAGPGGRWTFRAKQDNEAQRR